MWFKIIFSDNLPPIPAAIGDSGKVFFKAGDVGKLLGFSDYYSFSVRYAVTDFNKMSLPLKIMEKANGVTTTKCLVFNYDELMHIIQQKKHKTLFNVDYIKDLWMIGSVDELVPQYPVLNYRDGPELRVGMNKRIPLQDWIQAYRIVVDNYLDRPFETDEMDFKVRYLRTRDPSTSRSISQDSRSQDSIYIDPSPRSISQDSRSIYPPLSSIYPPQDSRSTPQDPRSQDSRSIYQDPRSTPQDPRPQDPRSIYQDPRSIYQDPRSTPQDPRSIYQDPRSIYQDHSSIYQDPSSIYQDPSSIYQDSPQDLRSVYRDSPQDPNDDTVKIETIDVDILSPEPEQLHSLRMDFECFPPDQIVINFQNMTYMYTLMK